MREKIGRVVLLIVCFAICALTFACAETIVLRNGEKIEGKITKDTPKYVKVQTATGETIYFKSVIQSIDQKEVSEPSSIQPNEPMLSPQENSQSQSLPENAQPAAIAETPVTETGSSDAPSAQEPFRTLKILYEITEKDPQAERSFSSVVYIDRNANKRRSDLTEIFQPGQMHAKRDEITIMDGTQSYFFDMAKGVASVVDVPQPFSAWVDAGNEAFKEEDAIARQEVAGKKCFVYKSGDVQTWVWQGITLKRIEKNEQMHKRMEAISIEVNPVLSDDVFTIPESIKANMVKKDPVSAAPRITPPENAPEPVMPDAVQEKIVEPAIQQEVVAPVVVEAKPAPVMQQPSLGSVVLSPDDFRALKQGGTGALEALAKIDLNNIETGLELFRVDTGRYPTTSQGLRALMSAPSKTQDWQGPYLSKEPRDPWGNAYVYAVTSKGEVVIYSKGPDGKAHTEDDIAQ